MTTTTDSPAGPATDPAALQSRLQAALALHQQGRLAEAGPLYEAILRDHPQEPNTLHLLGVLALQGGDAATAVARIGEAIAAFPGNPEFHLNQAVALRALGRLDEALAGQERALALSPDHLNGHLGRAALLKALGRSVDAVAAYERALALNPDIAEVHFNLGNLQRETDQAAAAAASYARALALKPGFTAARINLGTVQLTQGDAEPALAAADAALAQQPDSLEALLLRANALMVLQRQAEAIPAYDRVLAQKPDHLEALRNRGKALFSQTRDPEALASLEAALALAPDDADLLFDTANVLAKVHRREAAIATYDRALALRPDFLEAWHKKGTLLFEMNRLEEALVALEEALRLRPDSALVLGGVFYTRAFLCDWTDRDATLEQLRAAIGRGEIALMPFAAQSLIGDPSLQLQIAHAVAGVMGWPEPLPGAFPERRAGEKIRIGYFSADFRDHPVSQLMAGVFERHDRNAFEVIGFAFGPPPAADDDMRRRLEGAFDRLIDVTQMSDPQIAQLARDLGIDIAVDLGGYTQNSRTRIFACRAAPVQVSYIGFLGSMGVPFMDYLVADHLLVPAAQRPHYSERIAWLPWYQANDNTRRASDRVFTRAELGLPATGPVLACFNNHYKITPPVFDSWMRILTQVPDASLILMVGPEVARQNLRKAAAARGVDTSRLAFADRVAREDYLARYRAADLFLDTWPCNAGATASDALLMGVPVLTCPGDAMVSRMAASVLTALEMPELITASQAEYEQRAVALARDPAQMAALKEKVAQQLTAAPLFDVDRFTRYLEEAYRAMQARRIAGLAPADLDIPR